MKLDLNELERFAKDATPQEIDASEIIEGDEGKIIECPICGGEGYVSLEADYCNFDDVAIGVQFYGIGNEHGAAERYYRAANPAVVLELVRRLRAASSALESARAMIQEDRQTLFDCHRDPATGLVDDELGAEAIATYDRVLKSINEALQPPKNEG